MSNSWDLTKAMYVKFTTFNILTYLLTPWCRVLLEKLTGLQLVKKFPAFHGTRRFITALTCVRHLSLSWTSPILFKWSCIRSADERREVVTYYRYPEIPNGARGPETDYDYVAYVFVFLHSIIVCRLYIWTLSDQAPSHSATDSLSDLV